MTPPFVSPLTTELQGFLVFKRALGYKYQRGEFTLREFDRFLSHYVGGRRRWHLRDAVLAWLCRKEGRKPVTVTFELAVIRQFCLYRRRSEPSGFVPGRVWAPQSTEAKFLPYIFTLSQMRRLLRVATQLDQPGPRFPRALHTLVLVLYCTGLRLGEVARLRLADVDLKRGVLFVSQSKGRSRWVPFHPSLTPELRLYLAHRGYGSDSAEPFFLRQNGRPLSAQWVSDQLRGLFRRAGMKPAAGRVGPRPYDLRHTFAVHRLKRWYRSGVDIRAHLPWLSAYMGHLDILGTQTYLTATPDLLAGAARRFRRRFRRRGGKHEANGP